MGALCDSEHARCRLLHKLALMYRILRFLALCLVFAVPLHGTACSLDLQASEPVKHPQSAGFHLASFDVQPNPDGHGFASPSTAKQDDHCACPHGNPCPADCHYVTQSTSLSGPSLVVSIQRFLPSATKKFENFVPAGLERPPRAI
jgi:hypothetical protein